MPRTGRPPAWTPDERSLEQVELLAAQGLTMDQIADCLGIARSTLFKNKAANPDLSDAIKRGRSKGVATVTNALMKAAKEGNVTAQIFYLKNRSRNEWADRQDFHHSGSVRDLKEMSLDELIAERDRLAGRDNRQKGGKRKSAKVH